MGNCMGTNDGSRRTPLHTVYVSAFYMDKYCDEGAVGAGLQWATITATALTIRVREGGESSGADD